MACVEHQKRIKELEGRVKALEAQVKRDHADAKGARAQALQEAADWVSKVDPDKYVGYSETSGTWPVGDLGKDFRDAFGLGASDAG